MTEKLSVCFVWHMHQPLYKDRITGLYLMPWARLHAIKDYLDMPLILKDFPKIQQTFNLVPSLLEQLKDYGDEGAVDQQLLLTCKDQEEYTRDDRVAILHQSFQANLERQIKPNLPYYELYLKREHCFKRGYSVATMVDQFTEQEFADMTSWFNLAWFDPLWISKYAEIANCFKQGSNFRLEQRKGLIEIQRKIIRQIIPVYRDLLEAGQIEIITSPYYHPILPLLIDSNIARYPNPYTSLPKHLYFQRSDALNQIERGFSFYKKMFGTGAKGMWPSELAVSPAACELIAQCGIDWVVLDEGLLTRTLDLAIERDEHGNLSNPEVLCQPYKLVIGDSTLNVFFREVVLSNEISFAYGKREPREAAHALYMRLKHVQDRLLNWQKEGVVVIALDGENCWETYEEDGHPFLQQLYKQLAQDDTLCVCSVTNYLKRNPATEELYNIHSGSWIAADYHIWIGEPVKNKAWDLLAQTRQFLVRELRLQSYPSETVERAWEEIYAAEGSDWFWWFGEPNNSEHDLLFDEQFRLRLKNVYKLLGKKHPVALEITVYEQVEHKAMQTRY